MTPAEARQNDEYDDRMTQGEDLVDLWRTVLMTAITDAINGPPYGKFPARLREIEAAREYICRPNRDFNEVCSLADLDPVAVRARVARMIAKAPTAEALAQAPRRGRPKAASPTIGHGA